MEESCSQQTKRNLLCQPIDDLAGPVFIKERHFLPKSRSKVKFPDANNLALARNDEKRDLHEAHHESSNACYRMRLKRIRQAYNDEGTHQ